MTDHKDTGDLIREIHVLVTEHKGKLDLLGQRLGDHINLDFQWREKDEKCKALLDERLVAVEKPVEKLVWWVTLIKWPVVTLSAPAIAGVGVAIWEGFHRILKGKIP